MGSWTFKALKALARFKRLRGTALDLFGKTDERRMERQLIKDYEGLVDELLANLSADKLDLAVQLARLPEKIRGYGHVKLAHVVTVRAQWQELLDRFHGRAMPAAQPPLAVIKPAERVKGVAEL